MTIKALIIYFIASIILFFILTELEKRNNKISNYTIVSLIYIILLSGLCTELKITPNNDAIFIVFIFELLLRIIYTNMIEDENFFKKKNYTKKYAITFISVFLLNTLFIRKVKNVFLNAEQLKIIIWLLIILYAIKIIKDNIKEEPYSNIKQKNKEEKREYIIIQYAKLKNKYSNNIKTKYKELIPIIYSIMIYENKNKPELFRKLDYYTYKINGKSNKFGIMGIYSKYYIDDETSISIAIKRLEKIYSKISNNKDKEKQIIKEYYQKDNYIKEVSDILNEIKRFDHK